MGICTGLTITANSQSLLDRSPNLQNGYIGDAVHFNFNHRMTQQDIGGERRLTASPVFLLGVPVKGRVLFAVNYASSSDVVESNEWEVFSRWKVADPGEFLPVGVAVTAAYNSAAQSADGEINLNFPVASLELIGIARFFSGAFDTNDFRMAAGGGVILRLSDSTSLTGDVVSLLDLSDDERVVWGAGIHLRVPRSPHTFSAHFTNASTTTLHGSTRGGTDVYWGFEFTTPLTFLHGGE